MAHIGKYDEYKAVRAALTNGSLEEPWVVSWLNWDVYEVAYSNSPYNPFAPYTCVVDEASTAMTGNASVYTFRVRGDAGAKIYKDGVLAAECHCYDQYASQTMSINVGQNTGETERTFTIKVDFYAETEEGVLTDIFVTSSSWTVTQAVKIPESYGIATLTTTEDNYTAKLMYNKSSVSKLTDIIIDGVSSLSAFTDTTEYTFPTAGEHTVKYVFTGSTLPASIVRQSVIETFSVSSTVTATGIYCFNGCSALTSVSMPSVTYLDSNVMSFCPNLSSITLGDLTYVGQNAFRRCDSLTEWEFGPAFTGASYNIFNQCSAMTAATFNGVTGLTEFQSLGDNMTSLSAVTFPDCIQTYCQSTMSYGLIVGATNLSAVTFGSGATTFLGLIFKDDPALTSITCLATTAPSIVTGVFSNITENTGTLYVPTGSDYSTWLAELGENWSVSYI